MTYYILWYIIIHSELFSLQVVHVLNIGTKTPQNQHDDILKVKSDCQALTSRWKGLESRAERGAEQSRMNVTPKMQAYKYITIIAKISFFEI